MSCFLIVPLQTTGEIGRNIINLFYPKSNLFIRVHGDAVCCLVLLNMSAGKKKKNQYNKTFILIFKIKIKIRN